MDAIAMTQKERRAPLDEDACWRALTGDAPRTHAPDFIYGVLTTGVFCRPGCRSRRPRRENVRFFPDTAAAMRAGLRPCKRCKPMEAALGDDGPDAGTAARIAAACRRLEAEDADAAPTLASLAGEAGISPFHFHRLFKAATGLTPKAYALAVKEKRLREALPKAGSVTQAIYEAGYSSSSRFYEGQASALGMAPARYRAGGAGARIGYAVAPCWLGLALVAATEKGICALLLGDDAEALTADLRARFPAAEIAQGGPGLARCVRAALDALAEPELAARLPLDVRGTAFQHRVWAALRAIPPGKTASYGDIARQIGEPGAVRAVASACAANPVAVGIPCHRVVRKGGALSGYRWGVERKRRLLTREGAGGGEG